MKNLRRAYWREILHSEIDDVDHANDGHRGSQHADRGSAEDAARDDDEGLSGSPMHQRRRKQPLGHMPVSPYRLPKHLGVPRQFLDANRDRNSPEGRRRRHYPKCHRNGEAAGENIRDDAQKGKLAEIADPITHHRSDCPASYEEVAAKKILGLPSEEGNGKRNGEATGPPAGLGSRASLGA